MAKLDLALLDKFVSQKHDGASSVDKLDQSTKDGWYDYCIELAKVVGLMSGTMQELQMLIADAAQIIKAGPAANKEALEKLAEVLTGAASSTKKPTSFN